MKFFPNLYLMLFLLSAFSITAFGQNTGGVKGKIRNTSGEGIPDVTITVQQKEQDVKTVKTNTKGEFIIDGLEFGLYNLLFSKDNYNSGKLKIEINKKNIIDLGNRLTLKSDQGTQVIIKGSVFNQDGVSIYGAEVKIERISEDGSTKKVGTGFSTVGGEFTFRFPEGTAKFRITATAKGVSNTKEISVDSAGYYRLALTLNLPKKQ